MQNSNSFLTTLIAIPLITFPVHAETVVDDETEERLLTSTAGDITITKDGTIELASGAAITVNSDNDVTNGGTIEIGDADGATAILVEDGRRADVVNSGTISITEDFVPDDDDANGIADGQIASASGRYGIRIGSGVSGSLENSGTITVEGLDSFGIAVEGPYSGSILHTGTINMIGDNSTGLWLSDVDGDVTVEGSINVVGAGATAVNLTGDVSGTFTVQGALLQKRSYTNDDDETVSLSRAALRNGAPTVAVSGNIAGGILIAAPPADEDEDDDDEDNDGVADDKEGTGSITAFGTSPGLLIGGSDDIEIGRVTGDADGYSLVVDGSISASAHYSSTDAFAIVIGGEGGDVNLPGGIAVNGTVSAKTNDSQATALLINEGATVERLYNSGTIIASISSSGDGALYAVRDLSGTLTSIENTGFITASGSSEDTRNAIDLSANTSGVTIRQYLNDDDRATITKNEADGDDDTTIYTAIRGNIVTGSGDDLLDIAAGVVSGNTYLNDGDDVVRLSGNAAYGGEIHFGDGIAEMTMSNTATFIGELDFDSQSASLILSDSAEFTGTIAGGENLTVDVAGGRFGTGDTDTISFDALTVRSGASLGVYIDGDAGKSSLFDVDSAVFEDGARISATISSLANTAGSYRILTANKLTGLPEFDSTATGLPLLFNGKIAADDQDLILTISLKTAEELDLTRPQGEIYEAIIAAAPADDSIEASLLGVGDVESLQRQFNELLPDHAGGVFDVLTRGSRLAARHVMDDSSMYNISDVGGWVELIYLGGSKSVTETIDYELSGYGISGGLERETAVGYLGFSLAYFAGSVENNGGTGTIDSSQYELAGFWRVASGPFYAFARVSGARVSLDSSRTFTGSIDDKEFTRTTAGSWSGWLYSAAAGASYRFDINRNLSLRPMATIDYFNLSEGGYEEDGGGDAMDLIVADRSSDAMTATTTLTASYSMGRRTHRRRPLTFELEGGRRHILGGELGNTVANFEDGESFTITGEDLRGGWLGEVRVLQGGMDYTWQLAVGADQVRDDIGYTVRGSLSLAF